MRDEPVLPHAQVSRGTTQAMETLRNGMISGIHAAIQVVVQETQRRELDAQRRINRQ
jgi:hypothetical protein